MLFSHSFVFLLHLFSTIIISVSLCKFLSILVYVRFNVFFVHILKSLVSYFQLKIIIYSMFISVIISTLLPYLLYSIVQWKVITSRSTSLLLYFSCLITLYTNSFMLSTSIYVVRSHWRYLKFRLTLCCIFVCNLISTCFLNLIVFSISLFILGKHDLKRGLSFANVLRSLCCFGSWKIIVVHDWKITVLFHNFYIFLLSAEWLFHFC